MVGINSFNTGDSRMEGVEQVEVRENTISLYSGCRRLDMYTSASQTQKIDEVQTGENSTYGYFVESMRSVNSELKRIEVNGLEDGLYHADAVFTKNMFFEENVDFRPSDAVGLAKASQTNVYIDRNLLVTEGTYFCSQEDLKIV